MGSRRFRLRILATLRVLTFLGLLRLVVIIFTVIVKRILQVREVCYRVCQVVDVIFASLNLINGVFYVLRCALDGIEDILKQIDAGGTILGGRTRSNLIRQFLNDRQYAFECDNGCCRARCAGRIFDIGLNQRNDDRDRSLDSFGARTG